MKALKILWLVTLTFIVGCSSQATGRAGVPQPSSYPATSKEYRIQPGDQLDIKLFYNPELNEQLTVRSDGRITLQLVNDVVAAGLTPAELTAFLNKAYAGELENPKVAVIVRTSVADKVYVDGEVNRAGLVTLTGPTTVLQSISQAGGIKESAKADQVIVLRRIDDGTMAGIELNLEQALHGADASQDIFLQPNDIVYVPKSTISNVNTWIDLYIRKNIPLPIGLGYSL
ncbi:MAG: sugar transporter [Geobacteraceae bacterium GWC2_58_44]|nr:MAG: sugar transporter [Geobacteraceae bacterium GWC2_58_44]HBG07402.1 sugar transporter [Geobacter sp.]